MTDDRDKTQPLSDPGAGREETFRTDSGLVATAYGQTDVGCVRSVNQDTLGNRVGAYLPQVPDFGLLYAVADGMGGHARGEVASALAIEQLFARYYGGDPSEDPRRNLAQVLIDTNGAVYQAGRDGGGASMGTTLTMALLRNDTLFVGNIGDSRTYCIRAGQIEQLTHDHSLIGEQVRSGLLTEAQARQSSIRNVITRAVGYRDEVEPDVFTFPIMAGDIILLCSDGLHSMVDSQELVQAFTTQPLSAAVPTLIDLAKQRGGPDNITALAVRIDKLGGKGALRDDATTVPFTPSLDDAVTRPMLRVEEGGEQFNEVTATGEARPAAPMPIAPPPAMPPPPAAKPQAISPPPPASRRSSRFPLAFLVLLPLLLLAAVGGGLVAFASRDDPSPSGTVLAGDPSPGGGGTSIVASSIATTSANPTIAPRSTDAPNVIATTASAAGGTATAARTPQSSAAIAQPTPPVAVAPTSTTSAGSEPRPSGTSLLLINGTIQFRQLPNFGQIQRIPDEWEIVIYAASTFPGGVIPQNPTAEQLADMPLIWRGAIKPATGNGPLNYEVSGEWTLSAPAGDFVIALREKDNSARIVLPEVARVNVDSQQTPKTHNLTITESLN